MRERKRNTASRLARLADWSDQLPPWARPAVYGALVLLVVIGMRGGVVAVPLLVVVVLVKSDHPARDLLVGAGILGVALIGGAASGTAYALAQRWIAPIPRVVRSLAGMVTVAPYMAAVTAIVHVTQSSHWNDPLGGA